MRPPPLTFALSLFFGAGALIAATTVAALLLPGSPLDAIWSLKPQAHSDFLSLGALAVPLMIVVSAFCALAAVGLWRGARWGTRVAIAVLTVNAIGDTANALLRHDYRTLIGLPVAGGLVWYLVREVRSER